MLSVILPFYKKLSEFRRVLPLNLPYFARPWVEVVLVLDENESEAETVALLRQYPQVRWKVLVNDQPHPWQPPCKSINVGLRHATRDRVLVCSPESLFVTDVPALAVSVIDAVPRGVMLGRVAFGTFADLEAWGPAGAFKAHAAEPMTPMNVYGSIAARRAEFEAVQGYDEGFREWGGDDDNIRVRLEMNGARLVACADVKLLHLSAEPRPPYSQHDPLTDLRKCSPSSPQANTSEGWGRSFDRVAWQSDSLAAGADHERLPRQPAPAAAAVAMPIRSRRQCPVCGRLEHFQNPMPFCVRCDPPASHEGHASPRVVCVIQAYNEERHLRDCFDHLREHVDGFVVLDDGSTDATGDIAAREPGLLALLRNPRTEPHVWNEKRNKQQLLEAAKEQGAQWVLVCDADERYEALFLQGLRSIVTSLEYMGYSMMSVAVRELWNRPDQFRADGIWGRKRRTSLIRLPDVISFNDAKEFHGTWVPDSLAPQLHDAARHAMLLYHMYHLKMVHHDDRVQRRDFYQRLDPDNKYQREGYAYLAEAGDDLQLEPITPDRSYDLAFIPEDLQALVAERRLA